MPIQEIPLELDHLLKKGGMAYWQAGNHRKSMTLLSPWAAQILGEKAGSISEEDDWFESIHPNDLEDTKDTILANHGKNIY